MKTVRDIMTAEAVTLEEYMTLREAIEALSGNICRCTGYGAILRAFETVTRGDA